MLMRSSPLAGLVGSQKTWRIAACANEIQSKRVTVPGIFGGASIDPNKTLY
jgi:hypothetical protein